VLSFRHMPTADDVAKRLGATSVGYIDPPAHGQPGRVDAVVDGQLTRFEFTVDATNAATSRPGPLVQVTRVAPSIDHERHAVEASDRARRPQVERNHHAALLRAEVASARRERGSIPAWTLTAEAMLRRAGL
jgi:hypothetical protein